MIRGYDVRGTNGDVGHVEGFLIDDGSWALCDLVVNARHRLPGRRVLVPSEWIAWVSWIELTVHVDLPIERILGAPSYDPSRPVTGSDEMRLRAYYGRPTRHPRDRMIC